MTARRELETPLGPLLLVADEQALREIRFLGPNHGVESPADPDGEPCERPGDRVLAETGRQLEQYLAGERREFDLPLGPAGTEFQLRVWRALEAIPYGATTSYGALAGRLGVGPKGARAVGLANGANPLSIVVPCHRVIGADGSLTGYGGGLERKRWLLRHEGAEPTLSGRLF